MSSKSNRGDNLKTIIVNNVICINTVNLLLGNQSTSVLNKGDSVVTIIDSSEVSHNCPLNERVQSNLDTFSKAAFYGWDTTWAYLITGVSDTRERRLYENKIVRGKLKTIEQCTEYTVSHEFC